jgi:ribonuclease VapC
MFIDSSVFVAIVMKEKGHEGLLRQMEASKTALKTSPVALVEAALSIGKHLREKKQVAYNRLCLFIQEAGISVEPIIPQMGMGAIIAYDRYGKGSGSGANLNLGDVFAYACAKHLQSPFLYVGEDFARTDLE